MNLCLTVRSERTHRFAFIEVKMMKPEVNEKNMVKTTISVGAKAPFRVLHISDTHLTRCDERDDERKMKLAAKRERIFPYQEQMLDFAAAYAKKENIPILHTGDIIDFVSEANLDYVKKFTAENDVFMAAGNHEFSLYVGEAWEDAEYRNQSLAHVQESFTNDIRFSKREIGGVNFVAIDNSYYLFEKEQLDALKNVVAEGKPIVLMLHNPLYSENIYRYQMEVRKTECAYVVDAPEEKMQSYSDHRYRQQRADTITKETVAYIKSESLIRALLIGHMHYDLEDAVTETLTQYLTGCETIREITFI